MSVSSNLEQIVWLGVSLLICGLQVMAAILLFRERNGPTWMMLIGSLLYGLFIAASQIIFMCYLFGGFAWEIESTMKITRSLGAAGTFGGILFFAGLILFALRHRSHAARIAELEQIIVARHSEVP